MTTMEEMYDQHGGIIYLTISLLVLALYLELFTPEVNEAENDYLKKFIKKEFRIILIFPLILLVALGLLKLLALARGSVPSYWILDFLFPIVLFYDDFWEVIPDGIRRNVIIKAIFMGYFFCHLSLFLFIFGIFGPFQFDFSGVRYGRDPEGLMRYTVNWDGEFKMISLAHGYLTYVLYHYTPDWFLFIILFYVSRLESTASFRASWWFFVWLGDRIGTAFNYLKEL